MKPKQLLFSLTRKDFVVTTFCTGGPGGQHKNAKENGVRISHPASGAVAQEVTHREQYRNKKLAFEKLAQTPAFKRWHKAEVARLTKLNNEMEDSVIESVDRMMRPENLKVEEY